MKCIDWSEQGFYDLFTQVSEDMKYLYSQARTKDRNIQNEFSELIYA